jgi:WD40 repeat protein
MARGQSGESFNRARWPSPGNPWRAFLEFLDRVHDDNGRKSLRTIGAAVPLSASQVGKIVRGEAPPPEPQTVARLVRAMGGGTDEAAEAVALAAAVGDADLAPRAAWTCSGVGGAGHFLVHGCGQRNTGHGGDLFRGRAAALAQLRNWLTAPQSAGAPLVVCGQPGAGKSAVVSRVVLELERSGHGRGLAWHARSGIHRDLLREVAVLTGARATESDHDLVNLLRDRVGQSYRIVVDALDEVQSVADRDLIAGTLTALAALDRMRVVVTTRAPSSAGRFVPGAVLPLLGIYAPDDARLIDLDTDTYFDPAGLREYAANLLTQQDAARPGPPGGAWLRYRADPQLTDRLASAVVERAGRNYLVAALVCHRLSMGHATVDPAGEAFDLTALSGGIGEALYKYLHGEPEPGQSRIRLLFTCLAYAYGDGLDDGSWLAFAEALGCPATGLDLEQLRSSTAMSYLTETMADRDGPPVTRLFHQALADQLLAARRHRKGDHGAILSALLNSPAMANGAYARRYAPVHALAADRITDLINDKSAVSGIDPGRLLSVLSTTGQFPDMVSVLRRAVHHVEVLPPGERRLRLLELTAAHLGLRALRERLRSADCACLLRWAHPLGAPYQELRADGVPQCVAVGRLGNRDVVAAGTDVFDRTSHKVQAHGVVHIWDADGGRVAVIPHDASVTAVAIGRLGTSDCVVAGARNGLVHVWDPDGCTVWRRSVPADGTDIGGVAVARLADRDIVMAGSAHGRVYVWDADGRPIGLLEHGAPVNAIAAGRLGDREVVVTAGDQATLRVWDAQLTPIASLSASIGGSDIMDVAIGSFDGRDVIAAGTGHGLLQLWDADGKQLGLARVSPRMRISVTSVAIVNVDGDGAIAVGDGAGAVWLRRAKHEDTENTAWSNPLGSPVAIAAGRLGAREVIATAYAHPTTPVVRLWPADADPAARTGVAALAVGRLHGQPLIGTGRCGGEFELWDEAGRRVAGLAQRDTTAVAIGHHGGREMVVAGGAHGWVTVLAAFDGPARITSADEHPAMTVVVATDIGSFSGVRFRADEWGVNAVAMGSLGGRDVIVTGGEDKLLRLWDAYGRQLGAPGEAHIAQIRALAVGRIAGQDVIASAGLDGRLIIWDPAGRPLWAVQPEHQGKLEALAIGQVNGNTLLAAGGGGDHSVTVWEWVDGSPRVSHRLAGHTEYVRGVAFGRFAGHDVIVTAGADRTVRVWDPAGDSNNIVIDLLEPPTAVAINNGTLYAAAGPSVVALDLSSAGG